ncbi:hypothetical protein GGS24DRAFT_511705 [Hypoxylon argillaceum]|nr:hypothetical protein GGS24DRAFT_511705 [Hypoxylon argillaceum]
MLSCIDINIGSLKALTSDLAPDELWVGSLGAHREAGRRSLDYRLRDASTIREHVIKLLTQLEEAIRDASSASSDPIGSVNEALDALDLELIEYLKDDGESSQSSLDLALADISHVIDCLFRLSITIRNPAPHDQFMSRAGAETLGYYEKYDISHVQEKFPRMGLQLAERLGRAITYRRHFFKYREDHYVRISGGIDDDGGPDNDQTTVASSVPEHQKDSLGENPLIDLDARSDISRTSYAPSLNNEEGLRVPPIPQQYLDGPFLCPFCYLMIEVNSRNDWKKHVFRDLQPYMCLDPLCLTPDHKFSRRSDWTYHMKQVHWRVWQCPYECQKLLDTSNKFLRHIQEAHYKYSSLREQDTFETMCSQEDPKKASGPCPFCSEVGIRSSTQYSKHVGHHLEQLALFALPVISNGDDESGDQKPDVGEEDVESNKKTCECDHGPWSYEMDPHCHNCAHLRDICCKIGIREKRRR